MTIMEAEQRIQSFQIRDVETNGSKTKLSGIAIPYDTPADIGWFLEEHAAGSFAKSVKEAARSLPLTLFHEDHALDSHIGVASEWLDEKGALRGVWDLDDGPIAQRAAKLATPDENGNAVLGYMSIRFAPIRSEWTYAEDWNPDLGAAYKDRVRRLESRLLATSLVSTPAFVGATVEWVRSSERARTREATGREVDAWLDWVSEMRAKS
jgi:phage head maturation protease